MVLWNERVQVSVAFFSVAFGRSFAMKGVSMNKRWAGLAILGAVTALASPANAGEANGTITSLIARDSDGLVYVEIAGTPTGRPACASNSTYFMIPNENLETGKRLFALLLGAKLSDRPV